ncbi:MFS transporter [Mesorhizobium sp. CAU 1741]|uniref:MFS transporter n=1 Tax=Mesorhizobium sp. CAU 1741 TaxID=3140366 RepID=UPI00325C32E7
MNRIVVHALGLYQIFAWGSTYYLMAVLAVPIVEDTGWPLEWVVGSLSLGLLAAGIISPRVGDAIARYGGRPVLVIGSVVMASALLLLAAAPNLPVFMVGWIVLGTGMGAGLYDATFSTLGRIHGVKARASITTLTLWGGFASTVCWPLSAFFVETIGWRGACMAYAAILIVICMPLLLAFVPRVPRSGGAGSSRASAKPVLTSEERTRFRLFASIQILAGLFVTIVSVHLLTLLQARGVTLGEAVALGALIGPAQVGARVLEMLGRSRHHPLWTLTAAVSLCAAGLVLLASGIGLLGTALVLYGAGNGIFSIARGALPLALFGPERYASLMGRLARPGLIAQAAAPLVGAALISRFGPEATLQFAAMLGLANIALVVVLWIKR